MGSQCAWPGCGESCTEHGKRWLGHSFVDPAAFAMNGPSPPVTESQSGGDEAVADIVERRWGSTLGSKLGGLIRAACAEAFADGRARGIEEAKQLAMAIASDGGRHIQYRRAAAHLVDAIADAIAKEMGK